MFQKKLKKVGAWLLTICVIAGSVQLPSMKTEAANDNLALEATATASDYETSDFVASKANDGVIERGTKPESRWASSISAGAKWLQLSWSETQTIQSFVIEWERRNPTDYEIAVSDDGNTWTSVWSSTEKPTDFRQEIRLEDTVRGKFVRLNINSYESDCDGVNWNTVSVFEFEVYEGEIPDNRTELEKFVNELDKPEVSAEEGRIIMPEAPEGWSLQFYADYEQVIGKDGTIFQPLETKTVTGFYQVDTGEETAKSDEYTLQVPGKYTDGEEANEKPSVIPALQEWHGESGQFSITSESKVVAEAELLEIAEEFAADYEDITGNEMEVATGSLEDTGAGDFYFTLETADEGLGEEGYILNVGDVTVAEASDARGAYWATRSILQILKQTGETIAKGVARDYPKYEVRSFILDVGRKSFELDTIKQIAQNMAWYKLNDFHVHLNDNLIFLEDYDTAEEAMEEAYAAFRLESDVVNEETGETATATDLYYTKDEFRSFIQESRRIGIDIVPEIDMPAHSLAFTRAFPQYALSGATSSGRWLVDHLNIQNQDTRDFAKSIFGDYMSDQDPVFDEETIVHIGTDEFSSSATAFREFSDEMIAFVQSKGRTVRMWGSLSQMSADVPVRSEGVQLNIWNTGWANPQSMFNEGFDLINTVDGSLYIVPGAGYYYDYLPAQSLYNSWTPNNMGGTVISAAEDQMLGGAYAIWNDSIGTRANGISEYDVFDRFFKPLPALSEKMWGEGKDKTWNEFSEIAAVTDTAPNTNLYYDVDTETETVMEYSFDEETIRDASGNGYDVVEQKNVTLASGKSNTALKLGGGESYITTPIDKIGPTNSISMWVKKEASDGQEEQILCESSSRFGNYAVKAVQKETGKVGFSREGYDYSFDYTLPNNAWVYLTINGYQNKAELYINNELVDTLSSNSSEGGKYATLVLPVERIGSKTNSFKGLIDEVKIKNEATVKEDFTVVTQKDMTASACSEHSEGYAYEAIDGDTTTYWHTNWAAPDVISSTHNHWFQLDLKTPTWVQGLTYLPRQDSPNGRILTYSIEVTTQSGETVTVVENAQWEDNLEEKAAAFDPIEATSVKLVILDAKGDGVGKHGTIAELNLSKAFTKEDGQALLDEYAGMNREDYTAASWSIFENAYAAMEQVLEDENSTLSDYTNAYIELRNAAEALAIKPDVTDLTAAINAAKEINTEEYTQESVEAFREALQKAEEVLASPSADQEEVDEALRELTAAQEALVRKPDVTDLTAAINAAKEINTEEYTQESVEVFREALQKAEEVLASATADQAEVDEALQALNTAKEGLEKKEAPVIKPDGSKLTALINDAKKLDLSSYTEETVAAFQKALAEAEKAIANPDATQASIDAALKALETAKAGLKKKTSVTPVSPTVPAKGTIHRLKDNFCYKVTKSAKKNGTVTVMKLPNKKNIAIPSTVKLNGYTFKVTEISKKAFRNNKKVVSVVIGKNVTKIGAESFYKCSKLRSITFKGKKAPKIAKKAFKGIKAKCKIIVPKKMPAKQLKNLKNRMKKAGVSVKAVYKKK